MITDIHCSSFGTAKTGEAVDLYELTGDQGMKLNISTYGGAIVSCIVPNQVHSSTDVVLGYDALETYEKQDKYLGSLIGRHANRIQDACFTLNQKTYTLYANNGRNHLHGGKIGFDKKVWTAEIMDNKLMLSYESCDGEEGYPGNLSVTVTYDIAEDNTLVIDYQAKTDQDTVCNLTNHSYFNLNGHNSGTVLEQYIQLFCDEYTEANAESLPNGHILSVENTPMDLRQLTRIGDHIDSDFLQLKEAGGYDNNWVIPHYDGNLRKAAFAFSQQSGISLTVYTTMPGLQFYTGNFLDGQFQGKNGYYYNKRDGFCLETQYFPNALAHDNFIQPILKKDETYHQITAYQFSVQQ